ncbi:MAG TPA: hypothetical protein VE915_03325 [Actinomycetota bacterium]|nr:hypothetical protein [Actinomycetota bacterium]
MPRAADIFFIKVDEKLPADTMRTQLTEIQAIRDVWSTETPIGIQA